MRVFYNYTFKIEVLWTKICMKVVKCAQIVFKMQGSILHPAFDTLCCLLPHGVGVLGHVVAHLTGAEESVSTEFSSSLKNPIALRFITL